MSLSESLEAAYLQTTYRVCSVQPSVDIRIGIINSALDQLLEANQVREWAFVTASNPQSRALSDHDNTRRNAELEQSLRDARLRYLEGIGVPDESGWPAECSYMILGITKAGAIAIARQWGQYAIVWGSLRSAPELLWTE